MYLEESLKQYLADLAAKKPAPGGGSAAALVGALGAALISMVANFTVGKENCKTVEGDVQKILSSSEKLRVDLSRLIDEDVNAYEKLSVAYKLPKDNPRRSSAIQDALKKALAVPYEVCRAALAGARLCPGILEKGNRNLVSDVGLAAEMLYCAYQSAFLNVEINLSTIKDEVFVARVKAELKPLSSEIAKIREEVVRRTKEKIG